MRALTWFLCVLLSGGSAAAVEDLHALVEQFKDARPGVRHAACKKLIAAGSAAAAVLDAHLDDAAANAHVRVAYLSDRANRATAPGDPWDRERNVIEGREVVVWIEGVSKHVRLREGARGVHLIEAPRSIRIEVTAVECGAPVTETYAAADPQALLNQHYGAWEIYSRWGGGAGTRWAVEGRVLTGTRFESAAPLVRRTSLRGFDVFRDWIRGQMLAAELEEVQRRAIEQLLSDGVRALAAPPAQGGVQAFLPISDALRVAVAKAGLPDPGELLPLSAHLRLGVTIGAGLAGAARVEALPPNSRGARLGLVPGDLVLSVNGRPVSARDLAVVVRKVAETPLVLEIRRDGQELRLSESAAPQGGTP